jgi:hypothetical protein
MVGKDATDHMKVQKLFILTDINSECRAGCESGEIGVRRASR